MRVRLHGVVATASALVIATACSSASVPPAPEVRLNTSQARAAYVEVVGLSNDLLDALDDGEYTKEQWSAILRVSVAPDAPAMLGRYSVEGRALRFEPAFPLDPGRQYGVRFDPSAVAGAGATRAGALEATVGLPAVDRPPSTVVVRVYPTGDEVPENFLRMYVEFSGPMGRRSGIEFMKLLDESGKEIEGAFLPLDYEFWSPDHRRFTVFFDPGRVKDGILPNRQMGRPLRHDRTVTLVISREWRDEHGVPLKEDFRRTLRVGPPDERPLDPASWRIQAPPAGSRDAFVVTFPEALDHGLLMRALAVRRNGEAIPGDIAVPAGERQWTFVPKAPWRTGDHELLALDILEDLAGNQIGRAFEVDNFDTVDKSPNPQTITIPFRVRASE
jgi:hypothetical protein